MIDGLLAPLLAVGLFALWCAIGYAVLSVLETGLERGRWLLVAPAVGAAVSLLPIFWVSWWGVPVRKFAWPLLVALALIAGATLWIRRPHTERRDLWHTGLPLAAAFLLIGWPLVRQGFAWLSYVNDDMATYCLMAARLVDHGLVEPPSPAALASGSDLRSNMWLFEVAFGRPGSHLLLAWVSSVVGKSVLEVYMPVLVAMHLVLVAAAGALIWRDAAHRLAAIATCWLVAVSALTALGTVSQLLPQVFGLALACGFLALVWDIDRPPLGIGRAVVAAAVGATLLIVYTEFAPFVAIPWFLRLLALRIWRNDRHRSRWTVEGIVACGLLFAAPYADRFVTFLLGQSTSGLDSVSGFELFPDFRLSTAFATLWGILPLARRATEPLLSMAIVAGALAFAALWLALVRPLRRGESAAAMLLFMLTFGVILFARGNGFGLFKIAMYVQPFMLGTCALALLASTGHPPSPARWSAILLIAAVGLPAQIFYVRSSVNPALARTQILNQRSAMNELRSLGNFRGQGLDVDLPVAPTAKLAALFLHDVPLRFIGVRDFFQPRSNSSVIAQRFRPAASELSDIVRRVSVTRREFSLRDPAQPSMSNRFYLVDVPQDSDGPPPCDSVLTTTAEQSIINRTTTGAAEGAFRLLSCRESVNHLAFVSSALGRNYYYGGTDPIGLFALERDYFFPNRTFAGVGRHLLLEVLQPAAPSRLVLDFTASLKADGANLLPPVAVIGDERMHLHVVGRGSARLYSKPLAAQRISGRTYVALDFGKDGTLYPDSRRGLMLWLGRDVVLDPRRIVGHARNISLVTEEQYERMVPPSALQQFPQDLGSPALEYSGFYEDGWVAEHLVVVLRRPTGPGLLTLKGTLLPTASGSGMTITVVAAGIVVASERRDPGAFALNIPVPPAEGRRIAVELRFSDVRPLSDRDRRPASAHIDFLGVAPAPLPN